MLKRAHIYNSEIQCIISANHKWHDISTNCHEIMNMNLTQKIMRTDTETGLTIRNSYVSKSGFQYLNGVRDFGDMKIVEVVAKSNTTLLLNSIMVYDKSGILILDTHLPQRTFYSRSKVLQIVLDGLMEMLSESCEQTDKSFNELEAYELLDKKLKNTYFEQNYEAVLSWAAGIGIDIN